MRGLLNPKSLENSHFFLRDSRSIPWPWDYFHPVEKQLVYILCPDQALGRGLFKLPKLRNLLRKEVVHLYRSTRVYSSNNVTTTIKGVTIAGSK